ncbi:hypothetical protein BHUM_03316c [Candidatus Burkholderia humilis]|nr:hypothetical protein BHUM_03316c [Candidatus Burkholderia humilis]
MRKMTGFTAAMAVALALTGCVSTDDALLKTVPVGSGTSHLKPYDFVACAKAKWAPMDARVRIYALSSDTQAVSIPSGGMTSQSVVLAIAQQSANGTGYTIYGDVAVASRYVATTHQCD